MAEETSFWDGFSDSRWADLIYNFAGAKLANEAKPRAPAPTPMPTYPQRSTVVPWPALQAQGSDIGAQLGEIFASPRLWLTISAVALVVVLVKLRRG